MLHRVLAVGLLAGLLAGLAIALLQHLTTTPLILAAEIYEKAAEARPAPPLPASPAIAAPAAANAHDHAAAEDEGWSPASGIQRTLATSLATIVTAIGLALVLIGAMLIAGDEITPRRALAWGIAGFVATGLAPGLGLAPELPGAEAADLVPRQLWWAATAAATAGGLWLLLRRTTPITRVGGLILLAAPHLVGAPHAHGFKSTAPAELASHFTATSLAVQALLWVLTAIVAGFVWQWQEQRGRTPARAAGPRNAPA